MGNANLNEVEVSFKSPMSRTPHSDPYFAGMQEGKLVLQHCKDCGSWTHPPGPVCVTCASSNREFLPVAGTGTIYTYTVNHRAMHSEFEADLPYIIVYVRLDEGPFIVSWLTGVDPGDVRIGQEVEVEFEKIDERTTLHRFGPKAS